MDGCIQDRVFNRTLHELEWGLQINEYLETDPIRTTLIDKHDSRNIWPRIGAAKVCLYEVVRRRHFIDASCLL